MYQLSRSKMSFAGKEDVVRKFAVDIFSDVRQFFDRVSAEGQISWAAAATAQADYKNGGMAARIERWRIGNFGIRDPAQRFVCRADFSSDGRIMGVVEQAKGDRDAGDNHSHPAAFG